CLNGVAFGAEKTTPPAAQPGAAAGSGLELGALDKSFMMQAGKDGMMEVHMGQMAQQQGQSAEVKKLGGMIVADHTKANTQLMGIAQKKGLKLDTNHKMKKLDKNNFDQAWLGQMVKDHQKDIQAYDSAAKNASDPEVKSFAKKTLPVLQKHLKAVEAAQAKVGTGPGVPTGTMKKS
ncbi:MAG TPA: DUF4142 domain-containing protein, partial [Chthoniobacterales bacterium]